MQISNAVGQPHNIDRGVILDSPLSAPPLVKREVWISSKVLNPWSLFLMTILFSAMELEPCFRHAGITLNEWSRRANQIHHEKGDTFFLPIFLEINLIMVLNNILFRRAL